MDGDAREAAAPLRRCVHETPWPAYALAWSDQPEPRFRLAVGSCVEHESNRIQVVELSEDGRGFAPVAEVEHPFPPTKLMWCPRGSAKVLPDSTLDMLAASGTTLTLYRLDEDGQMKVHVKLANMRKQQGQTPGQRAPLTSFDWSAENWQRIGTASVDTTCTIWNIEKQKIETQLIAHDKAVFDIAFAQSFLFASCGADGSVRLFDQRNLEHSTIIYESCPASPLLRLSWNKINRNHLATVAMDAPGVTIIDIRRPSLAYMNLSHREACANAVVWAPHSRNHLLCGTQDGQALLWDVKEASCLSETTLPDAGMGRPRPPPLLVHGCGQELYQAQWPASHPDWVAVGSGSRAEVLQI